MVADSMELLIQQPPAVLASEISAWVSHQSPAAVNLSMADLFFHAAKKVATLGELDLVAKPAIERCLAGITPHLVAQCPEEDRALLKQNLERLRVSSLSLGPAEAVPTLDRQPGSEAAKAKRPAPDPSTLSPEAARGLRRLSLFLERLQPLQAGGAAGGAAPSEQRSELASQFMTAAAVQSASSEELEEHLAPLREFGIDTSLEQVLKALARSLPGWGSLPAVPGTPAPLVGLQLNAMRQIVSLAEAPEEAAKRFRELVHAAIEQFNANHLGRAVTMFELAQQLASEGKVKGPFVDALRKGGHDYLDPERLGRYAERTDARANLLTILSFFDALGPEGLLRQLNGEPRRERRYQLLSMLEAHGAPARAKAWELLKASVDDPSAEVDPFFQMNLVYLLRVIARPADVSVEDEIQVVMRTPGRNSPPPIVKQVIAFLAAVRHEKSERALITYLRLFENMLLQPATAVYSEPDVEMLLDRTCVALARYATPRAWRAMVDHGLKAEPKLGSPMARLVEAGRQDLSSSKDLVDRVIAALRAELPKSVLGFTVKKNDDRIIWLIQALSGTPLPEVRAILQEIVEKHPGQKFTEAASKALIGLASAGKSVEAPAAGLSGDLDLFGLPNVLQTLNQSSLTGVLSLMKTAGQVQASLLFEGGRFRGAHFGNLRDEDAVYELFEKPFSGTFAFVSRTDIAALGASSEPYDVLGLVLEGVRRHDEFKRASTLVPDQVVLEATGTAHSPLRDEDEDFVHAVWTRVAKGARPPDCEASIPTDAYRIRRLLAHWVEEGALNARPTPAAG